MSDLGAAEDIHVVYAERNATALAFANAAILNGWDAGYVETDDPEWPVLLIKTPHGQVSWHLKREELPTDFPPFPGEWDGHDNAEKDRRLHRFIHLGERGTDDDARQLANG